MLYLDSADRDLLGPLLATGLFAGVTTNPLILHRAGLGTADLPALSDWVTERQGLFFAQATGATLSNLRRSAAWLRTHLSGEVVVKVVATQPGLTLARELSDDGVPVLVTAVYHPVQALLAAAARARYIAPYVRRAGENGRDGISLVRRMADIERQSRPEILAASLRSVEQVLDVTTAGAEHVTVSPAVAHAMLHDELTLAAAAEFEDVEGT